MDPEKVESRHGMANANPSTRMRLVSWNVQGRALDDPASVAARVDALGADVVCVQEIQRDQAATVRRLSRTPYGAWWRKHWTVVHPTEGLAVTSRWPLEHVHGPVALSYPWRWFHHTRRIAGGVTVAHPAGPVGIWNTHLSPGRRVVDRHREVDRLIGLVPTERSVVTGDLNARPGSSELAAFASAGWVDGHELVHPDSGVRTNLNAERNRLVQRLDYVLVSPDLVDGVVGSHVPGSGGPGADPDTSWWRMSDHLPVVVDLDVG